MHLRFALPLAFAFTAQSLSAEVVESDDGGFITRDVAVVKATPKASWLALISPAKWWNSGHTWSGDSANLTMKPQAGGCFCERIPENPDPERITLEGSVEHMRVIQAYPERALRLSGGLGPLQSEAVTGVLTIAMSEVEQGTMIVWEYAVSGRMRYEIPVIAKAVDGVMSQQLNGLADLLGRVDPPAPPAEPDVEDKDNAVPAPAEEGVESALDAMARKQEGEE